MKLILHIGTEKTGTTTTQHWAARNREALARQGVFYSRVLGSTCHTKLHLWCLTPGRLDESFHRIKISSEADRRAFRARLPDEFAAEVSEARVSGCHTFLISNELCHSRLVARAEAQKAREFLEPHFDEIELLCGLRPQIDLAVSHASNLTRAGQSIDKAFFDGIGPDSTYFNYKDFVERWSTVFGTETSLVPIRRTPDFTAVVAAHAGIDTTDLQPPVRVNEALDIRVMAMMNAMKPGAVSENRWVEPLAYIPREVLKQLPCEERLQPGLEIARSVQARFEETNRELTNGRTDVEMADFEPDWSRYEGAGNLDLLEQPCVFSDELAALVRIFNQDIALAELHNEIVDAERHLDLDHPVLARRRLHEAVRLLALVKTSAIASQRVRKFQARVDSIAKGLEGSERDAPAKGRHRAGEIEGSRDAPAKKRRRADKFEGGRDAPARERRRADKFEGGRDAPAKEHRRAGEGGRDADAKGRHRADRQQREKKRADANDRGRAHKASADEQDMT